jgi:hypothetical protein
MNVFMVTVSVGSGPLGFGSTLQKSCTLYKAYVWDFMKHFPLPTQYRYRFITLLAGVQGLFTHSVGFPLHYYNW